MLERIETAGKSMICLFATHRPSVRSRSAPPVITMGYALLHSPFCFISSATWPFGKELASGLRSSGNAGGGHCKLPVCHDGKQCCQPHGKIAELTGI